MLVAQRCSGTRVPARAISSRVVAPCFAAQVSPAPRRSWKWTSDRPIDSLAAPGGVKGMPAEPSTLLAREERCARICAHVSLQVPFKDGEDVRRHRHDSLPGSRLRRSQVQPPLTS